MHLTIAWCVTHFFTDDLRLPQNRFRGYNLFLWRRLDLAFYPAVIAANTNLQYLASQAYWNPSQFNVTKGLLNKGVPQSPFFERYAANFLIAKSLHGLSGVLHANGRFLLAQVILNRACPTRSEAIPHDTV